MFEAYAVGISLKLKNDVSPQLAILSKEFEKLDLLTNAFTKSLAKISVDATGFKALTSATNASARALDKATLSAEAYERRLQALHRLNLTGGGIPLLPGGGGVPRLPGGGGGGAHGPSGRFHGGNMHIGPNGVGLGTAGYAMGDWFWPAAGGMAAYSGSKALFESAKQFDLERSRLRLIGMTDAQNADAINYATGLKIYGTTKTERLAAFREAQGVSRESGLEGPEALRFAKIMTPILSKLDAANKGLDDESKAALHQSNVALLRWAEQTVGSSNAERLAKMADVGFKLQQSSGGNVNYPNLLAASSQGGGFLQNRSPEGWAYAEPLLQEMSGSKYGTGVQTAGLRLSGALSAPPKNLIALMERLGLWTKDRHKLSDEDADLFNNGGIERFYIDRLMPLYAQFGINGVDRMTANNVALGRTGARIGNLVDKQVPTIERSVDAFRHAQSIEEASKTLQESLSGQEQEFEAAWTDFKTKWGSTMLPFFTRVLRVGAGLFRDDAQASALDRITNAITPTWWSMGKSIFNGGDRSSPFITTQSKITDVHTRVDVDGEKIYEKTKRYADRDMARPETGMTVHDPSMSLTPAGGY